MTTAELIAKINAAGGAVEIRVGADGYYPNLFNVGVTYGPGITDTGSGANLNYTVRLGPFDSESDARAVADQILAGTLAPLS